MSWLVIMAFALPILFGLLFIMRKFVDHMKAEQNMEIESFKSTLMDKDNPVGLSGDDLDHLKKQQAEAQKHLREVISKIPVEEKDGRFQLAVDKVKKNASGDQSGNGTGSGGSSGDKAS
ncbi:hypothetical protein INT08_10065 [Prosthecochloris sp. N3]|uniref:Phage shock protein B n=1 Tax=Prosthecochloris ethylica TaxID=2743976 RepID=A0ABR9XTX8_9CHLB|nr:MULTISPECIES: hypothetical protein [Prosthecochloris]MEC9486200.1 hypothetical protein [Prosthecochloris sp.]MBF0586591.1 hypothetical protein [Prosthecochloris ethylica]MBF0637512.1 hypothetical protein [Prosthecochloris ethylica]NUK47661.1 hypothetical protein [Prosthecochloris ethylica]RNA64331.1 hypothetical protein CR163_003165 [Prosthecochloris sp. ZM_2]